MQKPLTELEKHYLAGLLRKQLTWGLIGHNKKTLDEMIALTHSIFDKLELPN